MDAKVFGALSGFRAILCVVRKKKRSAESLESVALKDAWTNVVLFVGKQPNLNDDITLRLIGSECDLQIRIVRYQPA